MMGDKLSCFKAYDVRGIYPSELDEQIAHDIGRALAKFLGAKRAVVGFDSRLSSPALCGALTEGLSQSGCSIDSMGLAGTEMVYFATGNYGYDLGVMITASHNPPEYNGMKFVRAESKPISGDTGLWEVERFAREKEFSDSELGRMSAINVYEEFAQHLLTVVHTDSLKPLRILANAGNGCAGLAINSIKEKTPLKIDEMHFEPDGNFPNGVPNPILKENRGDTVARMQSGNYDFGVAWDGDYDRCFFYDERGNFIEGYYIVGLLAQDVLSQKPGAAIVHDPRLVWNTLEIIEEGAGRPVVCKSGHAFIKEKMRAVSAEYGGEMSAHHYFKSHWYCDSGIIPFLQIARLVSQTGKTLGELVGSMIAKFPCSGEVNSTVDDAEKAIASVKEKYKNGTVDYLDGISVEFPEWRFNLRSSNTEPVIRLNVETKGNHTMMQEKTEEILALIRG